MNIITQYWLSLRANVKKYAIVLIVICIIAVSPGQAQQWHGSQDTSGVISRPGAVVIGSDSLSHPEIGLELRSNDGNIMANGLYFYTSPTFRTDSLPVARLIQNYGMRYDSWYSKWVFSTNSALLVGYRPMGIKYNLGDLLVEGNTGLGTRYPDAKLDVYGDIDLNGNSLHLYGNTAGKDTAALDAFKVYQNNTNNVIFEKTNAAATTPEGAIIFATRGIDGAIKPSLVIGDNGKIGLGTSKLTAALTINGGVLSEELEIIKDVPEADYVFEEDYKLRPLEEVEAFIQEHKHLPEVPSAKEFKENGYKVGEMDNLLLQKVEELTLYLIEMKKDNQQLKEQVETLKKKIEQLEAQE